MENSKASKVKLGVFVTLGIALFIVGIYFIGQKQRLFSSTFRIKAIYKDINGLQVGNNVRFAGIDVGTVDNIEIINDTSVQVDVLIDKDVKKFIKKDAVASIGSEGLMGNKLVNLSSGTPAQPIIENNDFIKTIDGNNIEQILSSVKIVADNAAVITGDLAEVINNVKNGNGSIGKLFMDSTMAGDLSSTMSNLKSGTKGLDENMEAAKHNFLLKGYFNKKEKEEEKKREEAAKAKKEAEK